MRRPGQPKYQDGGKHYGGEILKQGVRMFPTRGGVPRMNKRVQREENAASKCGGPGPRGVNGQPCQAYSNNNVDAADVANEVEIRRSGGDDVGDVKIPVAWGCKHPDTVRAEQDTEY
jgi:hypothetical protein